MQTQYSIITESHPAERAITLLLNGKFCEDAIPELEQSISEARGAHQRVFIDLSEVTLVDRKAVQYFSEQASSDIKLVNCPIYLRRWIKQVSDE
jgi:anti-anti-sigma regulatory factor